MCIAIEIPTVAHQDHKALQLLSQRWVRMPAPVVAGSCTDDEDRVTDGIGFRFREWRTCVNEAIVAPV
jgi:ABC-type Fe2+-enterobactin transport system substrate-binding protein